MFYHHGYVPLRTNAVRIYTSIRYLPACDVGYPYQQDGSGSLGRGRQTAQIMLSAQAPSVLRGAAASLLRAGATATAAHDQHLKREFEPMHVAPKGYDHGTARHSTEQSYPTIAAAAAVLFVTTKHPCKPCHRT